MSLLFGLISLILGLYFFRNNVVISVIIAVLYFIFVIYKFRNYKIVIFLAVFGLGLLLPNINFENNNENHVYSGIVVESKNNYFIFHSGFEKFYIYEEDNNREVGDILTIQSEPTNIKMTTYESQFNFQSYLKDKGIKRSLNSYNINVDFLTPFRLKEYRNNYLNNFDDETHYLIDALLFCNKDYSSSLLVLADDMNLIYLFSMSGIFLYFLMKITEKLLSFILNEKYAEIISTIIFIPYLIFTFPKIGILRVIFVKVLTLINKYCFKRKFTSLEIVCFVAFLFLSIDFYLIYQQAFYVGFFLAIISKFLSTGLTTFKSKFRKILFPVFIYLLVLPITLINTYQLHLFTLLFQTLLLPLNELYVLLSLISFTINIPFTNILGFLTTLLTNVYGFFHLIDLKIPFGEITIYLVPFYYLFLLYMFYLIESKRLFHLKFSICPIVSLILMMIIPFERILINGVYFINVGQGDSILIQNKNKIVLIDTGGNTNIDLATETLIPFFNKKHIDHIDALIATHDDYDHSGASSSLIKNFKVYKYLKNRNDFPYRVGDIYLENLNNYSAIEDNDSSLVFNINFLNKKFLLTGDASVNVEKYLLKNNIDIDCDILKVAHHGSNTSSLDEFIKKCSPEEAIISVGAKNIYKHPSDEVIRRLTKYNVHIRRTDIEGTISYVSFGI